MEIAIFISIVFIFIIRATVLQQRKFNVIPTFTEYKKQYPHCVTGRGIRCVNCGSVSIKSTLFSNVKQEKHIYNCGHCGVKLYKTENK
jgi:predicted SprT family Zn-dependent metalloprotease